MRKYKIETENLKKYLEKNYINITNLCKEIKTSRQLFYKLLEKKDWNTLSGEMTRIIEELEKKFNLEIKIKILEVVND